MSKCKISCLFGGQTSIGLLLLRVCIAIIFMAHGAQKLFGWFDGAGFVATAESMSRLNLGPGTLLALLAGGAEFFGAVLVLLGFLTRLGALSLVITMGVAVFKVHLSNGLFISNGGYEYALTLMVASLAILISGPGSLAIDRLIAKPCKRNPID